jgi:hypothetical protein
MRELCAEMDPTPKQGYHEQAGVLIMAGPGIRAGADLGECSTLDLAPTLLSVMRLPIPGHMSGRVLDEAFSTARKIESSRVKSPVAAEMAASTGS